MQRFVINEPVIIATAVLLPLLFLLLLRHFIGNSRNLWRNLLAQGWAAA